MLPAQGALAPGAKWPPNPRKVAPPRAALGDLMIVDFQHHFTPRELFKEDLGTRRCRLLS